MDGPRGCFTGWSKSERERQIMYINTYMWNLEKWCCSSVSQSCLMTLKLCLATPWTTAHQASLSFTISWIFFKPMSIESVMPSSHLILCRPLLLLSSNFFSNRVLSMSWLFALGGQSIWTTASASVLPMNKKWYRWIYLQSRNRTVLNKVFIACLTQSSIISFWHRREAGNWKK